MRARDLANWAPIAINTQKSLAVVWCRIGRTRFSAPFFEQTIDEALRRPFNVLFQQHTSIDELCSLVDEQPGLQPDGFIFHMSRCGSTLVSQMLAASPANLVISEAAPIDAVLRAHLRDRSISDEQRIDWLRSIISA